MKDKTHTNPIKTTRPNKTKQKIGTNHIDTNFTISILHKNRSCEELKTHYIYTHKHLRMIMERSNRGAYMVKVKK